MDSRYDMIVIGAGISGLVMAHYCRLAGMSVLVLERQPQAGGSFHSARVENATGPFYMELGTHTCYNSYGHLLAVLEQLGLLEQLQARPKLRYRMLADGSIGSIASRLHFFELFTHLPRLMSLKKEDKTVAGYYRALLGPKNYQDVFRHAFNAVLCQKADDMPADMLFRKRSRRKDVMRSFTMPQGLQQIIRVLEAQVECRRGEEIRSIRHAEDGFRVDTASGSHYSRLLTCAAPVKAAARLLAGPFPDIVGRLDWIDEIEIETVGVVIESKDLVLPPLAGIIAADDDFYAAVSADAFGHPHLRGLAFHFKPGRLGEQQKLERIGKVLDVPPSRFLHVFTKTNRLPSPAMGHGRLIEEIDSLLAGRPLALTGNYFRGVAVEDCLERTQAEFARLSGEMRAKA
jgi:protoporphyrinogen/coproporphyrinogen III oxidase